jgi:hypothetical protein
VTAAIGRDAAGQATLGVARAKPRGVSSRQCWHGRRQGDRVIQSSEYQTRGHQMARPLMDTMLSRRYVWKSAKRARPGATMLGNVTGHPAYRQTASPWFRPHSHPAWRTAKENIFSSANGQFPTEQAALNPMSMPGRRQGRTAALWRPAVWFRSYVTNAVRDGVRCRVRHPQSIGYGAPRASRTDRWARHHRGGTPSDGTRRSTWPSAS